MKQLASKREVAAHAHLVIGGLAAHTTRLECLEAQLQQAGSFFDTLLQSRQELGAALAEMQHRDAAEQAKCDVQMNSRLVEIEVGGLLRGDAVALAELRANVALLHVPRAEMESLRETVLGVRDGLLGSSDALGAEVIALRAEQEVSHGNLQQLATECKVNAAKVEAQSAKVSSLLDAVQQRVSTRCELDDLDELRTRDACDMGQVRTWQLKLLTRQHRLEVSDAALLAVHERTQQAPSRAEVESLAAQAAQLMRTCARSKRWRAHYLSKRRRGRCRWRCARCSSGTTGCRQDCRARPVPRRLRSGTGDYWSRRASRWGRWGSSARS